MFLTDTTKYKDAGEQTKYLSNFKNFLCSRAYQFEPKYFITMFYGRNSDGGFLSKEVYRKRWDRNEVRKTHRFIRSKLKQCFGDVPMVFVIERHKETIHPIWGEMNGAFHTHLYLGDVNKALAKHYSIGVVEEGLHELQLEELSLHPEILRLLYQEDYFGCTINSGRRKDANLTELLLDACIRQAKWIGKFPDNLDIKEIKNDPFGLEFKRTFHYGLKQIDKEDDLNNVLDWHNSDLQKNGN